MKTVLLVFLLGGLAWGQAGNAIGLSLPGPPVNPPPCAFIMFYVDALNGDWYGCDPSTTLWKKIGPGAAGAVTWNSINSPTGNLSLAMANWTSTFTWNAATGAGVNVWKMTDTGGNTGTGVLWTVDTAAGSSMKPFQASVNGNGVQMSSSGVLAKIGTGSINADQCNGVACGTVTSFSAGTLSPIFTTSVATATSTPALSFILSNAGGYTVLGNNAVGAAAPAYVKVDLTNMVTGLLAPLTTRGDILYVAAGPVMARLALGAATAGKYAKSDGTDVVISTGSASGTGACPGGQAATTLNADAAPTCTAFGQGTVTSVSGTANEIDSTGGATPVLSLPAALTFTGKTVTNGTFTTPIISGYTVAGLPAATTAGQVAVVTDATAAGSCTVGGGSAIAFCRASGAAWVPLGDGGGAGGGTTITVNGSALAATSADLDDATPAAPAGGINIKWQKDALTPTNISGYLPPSAYATAKGSASTWTVTGATHALATCDLVVYLTKDNGTLREQIFPDKISCETAAGGTQFDVVVTWAVAQAGNIVLVKNGGAGANVGTVTNIATTSPITGGPITNTGTIACATCVTSAAALTSGQLVAGAGSQAAAVTNLTGDVTTSGGVATAVVNLPDGVTQAGHLLVTNMAAPASPAAGKIKVFSDSTNLILSSKNPSGVVSNTVVPDTGAANNFLTAVSASGVISKSQPACSSLSDSSIFCAATGIKNAQTATYQAVAADFTNLKTITVASGTFTITLVDTATQPANGKYINIINYGSGVVTVARSGQNINGGTASYLIQSGSALVPSTALVVSDGTNYFIGGGFTNPMTTAGDIIYGGTTGLPTRLAGAAGIYRSSGTAPSSAELSGAVTTSGSNATTLATRYATKGCTIIVGDPGAASAVLANDNDTPVGCGNDTGSDWTITTVACWADAGSPTVTPILTAGSATSVLTGACTCGTAAWLACSVNGSPVVKTFSGTGATCSVTPCTIDVNITTAGGTAKYIVVKIVGTI